MEDALVQEKKEILLKALEVLILVLMEDALVQKKNVIESLIKAGS